MAAVQARKLAQAGIPEEEVNCREAGCENLATTDHYCREHYIKNWARIREKRELLKDGKFEKFARELLSNQSEAVLKVVRHDLSSDETFLQACDDLGLREGTGDLLAIDTDTVDENYRLTLVKPEPEGGESS
jgi:hypothetical protein